MRDRVACRTVCQQPLAAAQRQAKRATRFLPQRSSSALMGVRAPRRLLIDRAIGTFLIFLATPTFLPPIGGIFFKMIQNCRNDTKRAFGKTYTAFRITCCEYGGFAPAIKGSLGLNICFANRGLSAMLTEGLFPH